MVELGDRHYLRESQWTVQGLLNFHLPNGMGECGRWCGILNFQLRGTAYKARRMTRLHEINNTK